jgi:uncharacterized membrane protein (DUF4010 family)
MSLVSGLWIWKDNFRVNQKTQPSIALQLDSPIAITKVLWFGLLFVIIQVGGTLLTKVFGVMVCWQPVFSVD